MINLDRKLPDVSFRRKMMKGGSILLFASIVWLTSCSPSEQVIQTAIANTAQIATSSFLTAAIPTFTPSPSPTSTPDLRIIKLPPEELLLSNSDLPPEAKYYLPHSSWTSPLLNNEIIQERGAEEGNAYISETGRVTGWWIVFRRGSNKTPVPEEVYDNPVMYQSSKGAQLTIIKYTSDVQADGYFEVNDAPMYGDLSRTFIRKRGSKINLLVDFSYKNYLHEVEIFGLESEATNIFMRKVIEALLTKLENAPLSPPN